jgi:PHD/YefM family antitoxin component YafN of YafNO toxin-antitoxin module
MSIHPQIIEKAGKKEFVVIPYEEFLALQEALEDYEDLKTLRFEKAEARNQKSKSLDQILRQPPATSDSDAG